MTEIASYTPVQLEANLTSHLPEPAISDHYHTADQLLEEANQIQSEETNEIQEYVNYADYVPQSSDAEIQDLVKADRIPHIATGTVLSSIGAVASYGAGSEVIRAITDNVYGNEASPSFSAIAGLALLGWGAAKLYDNVDFTPALEKAHTVVQTTNDRVKTMSARMTEGFKHVQDQASTGLKRLYDSLKPRRRDLVSAYSHEPSKRASDLVYETYPTSTNRTGLV